MGGSGDEWGKEVGREEEQRKWKEEEFIAPKSVSYLQCECKDYRIFHYQGMADSIGPSTAPWDGWPRKTFVFYGLVCLFLLLFLTVLTNCSPSAL